MDLFGERIQAVLKAGKLSTQLCMEIKNGCETKNCPQIPKKKKTFYTSLGTGI